MPASSPSIWVTAFYRAIATHYDKTARNFLAAIHLAAAVIWLDRGQALGLVMHAEAKLRRYPPPHPVRQNAVQPRRERKCAGKCNHGLVTG